MSSILWTLLILLIGFILLVGFVFLFFYALSEAFKPSTPEQQVKEFGYNLIGYDFGEAYEVLESSSQNNHPDRPQDLRIKLNDVEFAKLKAYLDTLEQGVKEIKKKGTLYKDTITKTDDSCKFDHTSTHTDCDYMFYSASAVVDYQTKVISFKSVFY